MYWSATRKPLPCLLFVLPMLLAYEVGVTLIGGASADAYRTGADAWMRESLAAIGLRDRWLPPMGLVLAILAWQAFAVRRPGGSAPAFSWGWRPRACLRPGPDRAEPAGRIGVSTSLEGGRLARREARGHPPGGLGRLPRGGGV